MVNSVSRACKSYLEGFQDLSTFNTNSSVKNTLGILKVVSYFTIGTLLFLGIIYGVSSLIGRVTLGDKNHKTSSFGLKRFGQTIEEQLEQLFRSSGKTQKLFSIDGTKVGVIFNPGKKSLEIGFMTVTDPVVLISDKAIPKEIANRITGKIPANCTYSTVSLGSINGRSIFTFLGFE